MQMLPRPPQPPPHPQKAEEGQRKALVPPSPLLSVLLHQGRRPKPHPTLFATRLLEIQLLLPNEDVDDQRQLQVLRKKLLLRRKHRPRRKPLVVQREAEENPRKMPLLPSPKELQVIQLLIPQQSKMFIRHRLREKCARVEVGP